MRPGRLARYAFVGGATLVLVSAAPAFAATITWANPGDSWWSTAAWTGGVPSAGDDIVFDASGHFRSTYDGNDLLPAANPTFASLNFESNHEIATKNGELHVGSNGLTVASDVTAKIAPELKTHGDQTWSVGQLGILELPSQVDVDTASTLILDIDGQMLVGGDLDGATLACIQKVGTGVLTFTGGGGDVGDCGSGVKGIQVIGGSVEIAASSAIGGKPFNVTSGVLFGGGPDAQRGQINQLNLSGTGIVSPGGNSGGDIGRLDLWGTSTWNGGTYVVQWDPSTGESDLVSGDGQSINVSDTVLAVSTLNGDDPASQTFTVLEATRDGVIAGAFTSAAGDVLADGDEFTSNGQIYLYQQTATTVMLTWLREAPQEPTDPGGGEDEIADTGGSPMWMLIGAGGGLILVAASLLLLPRRVRQ